METGIGDVLRKMCENVFSREDCRIGCDERQLSGVSTVVSQVDQQMHSRLPNRRVIAALFAVLALVASGCRSGDDAETGASDTSVPATDAGDGDGSDTADDPAGVGDFGDLEGVCGPGDAAGATATGVTDDEIKVGTISDAGYTGRPGLNQELFDAGKVFTEWCNDAGGINGRTITLVERDAKLTEYKQRITEACEQDFMLVGGGGVFDDSGQVERVSCLLPEIPAYQASSQSRGSALIANPVPPSLDELQAVAMRYLDERFPESTQDVGFLTGTFASTVFIDAQLQDGAADLGWSKVYEAQYNPAVETSWTPFAQAIKSAGTRGLVYSGESENLAALLRALDDIDYQLDWLLAGSNAMDVALIEIGGDAVRNVFMAATVVPSFLADENPATRQYLDLFEQYLPDGRDEAGLGYNSFSAWLLFAQAVKSCDSDVTRGCVFNAAKSVEDWTGGGLHAPTHPATGKLTRCGIIVEAAPTGFEVPDDFEANDGLFACSEDNVVAVTIPEGAADGGVTLESVGLTIDDLE